jgi:hypothetical protein
MGHRSAQVDDDAMPFIRFAWHLVQVLLWNQAAQDGGNCYAFYRLSVNGRSGRIKNDRPAPNNSNPIDP